MQVVSRIAMPSVFDTVKLVSREIEERKNSTAQHVDGLNPRLREVCTINGLSSRP